MISIFTKSKTPKDQLFIKHMLCSSSRRRKVLAEACLGRNPKEWHEEYDEWMKGRAKYQTFGNGS